MAQGITAQDATTQAAVQFVAHAAEVKRAEVAAMELALAEQRNLLTALDQLASNERERVA